jgi:hypothetical protein
LAVVGRLLASDSWSRSLPLAILALTPVVGRIALMLWCWPWYSR